MAVTQYIGARYVPIIFQNPDDNSNDWKAGLAYEPLTIVSYAGGSYTSKTAVPAGASNPADAPEYWVAIGLYSGQTAINTNSITQIRHAITPDTEAGYTCTSARNAGDYVWIAGSLYQCTANVAVNESYTEGINITPVDVMDIINSYFPVNTSNIADGAVTTNKLNNGAVTSSKIAAHSIDKSHMVEDKYIFIGDSYNTAAHHGGWGSKIITLKTLTEGVNVWNSGEAGAGMANGRMLAQAQTIAGTMSAAQKLSITKIMVVSGANDWAVSDNDIVTGVNNLESYLATNFPNAELMLVAGEWSYENDTIRAKIINAYNMYATAVKKMKFIDKAYLLFLCPYFLETDHVHPTASGMANMGWMLNNLLNGGNVWTKKYSDLYATVTLDDGAPGSNSFNISGDISEAGTHVYKVNPVGVGFNNYTTITHTGTKIGTLTHNLLFQRNAIVNGIASVRYKDENNNVAYGDIRVRIQFKLNNSDGWDVYLYSDSLKVNADWPIQINSLYLTFDAMLDFTQT